ncbi:MAG: hypothetical protein FWG75_09285 [Cystobacterineae bacterium]|nr:hypothetical protein [Cystobacterineae bacterium]
MADNGENRKAEQPLHNRQNLQGKYPNKIGRGIHEKTTIILKAVEPPEEEVETTPPPQRVWPKLPPPPPLKQVRVLPRQSFFKKLLEPFLAPRRLEKRLEEFWIELGKREQNNWEVHLKMEILNKVVMEQQLSIDKMWGVLARMSDRILEKHPRG